MNPPQLHRRAAGVRFESRSSASTFFLFLPSYLFAILFSASRHFTPLRRRPSLTPRRESQTGRSTHSSNRHSILKMNKRKKKTISTGRTSPRLCRSSRRPPPPPPPLAPASLPLRERRATSTRTTPPSSSPEAAASPSPSRAASRTPGPGSGCCSARTCAGPRSKR